MGIVLMGYFNKNYRKCSSLTSANKPCLRMSIPNSLFCRVHQKTEKERNEI
jgi:hypothetical protein